MKCKMLARVLASVVVLLALVFFLNGVEANFSNTITVNFSFPLFPSSVDPSRIGGTGTEQVFRSGTVPATGVFAGLDPRTNTAPPGRTLQFFVGNAGTIGVNDFVYAFEITNNANSTLPLSIFQAGSCEGATFTSFGFVRNTSGTVINPTGASFLPAIGQLFFTFNGEVIPPGQKSTILFFTSPDPPTLATAFIGGGSGANSVSANIDPTLRMYSPCPVSIATDKKIGCSAATVADAPLSAVTGSPVVYQLSVRNNGKTPLENININDPQLGGNLNSLFTVNAAPFTGSLAAGQTATATITTTATASVTNTMNVTGEYVILTQLGASSGQSLPLSEAAGAVLTDSTNLTVLPPPSLQAAMTVAPTNFTALPQTLTYTLQATNNGTAATSTIFDVDVRLKNILANPPAGITVVNPPTFPTTAQTLAAGATTQLQFGITVNTLAGWLALADVGAVGQSTSGLTATGTLVATTTNTCGTNSTTATASATTMFTPPCTISLEKTVACDTGNGIPPDAAFAATGFVVPNAKVYYRYKVTNTSLLEQLNDITISDPSVSANPINVGSLAAGAMSVINLPVTITQGVGTIVGTATVMGTCGSQPVMGLARSTGHPRHEPNMMQTVSADATTTVTVVTPKITAQKLVNGGTEITNYQLGTELVYTLTTGNDTTSATPLNLTIDDPLLRSVPGVVFKVGNNPVTLPYTVNNVLPGGSITVTASVTFATQEEFRAVAGTGYILLNSMVASATLPGGGTICAFGATAPALTLTADAIVRFIPPFVPQVCVLQFCEPNCPTPIPGQPSLAAVTPSSTRPGSLLLYNIYTSTAAASQDTALTLTNTGPQTIFGHIFLVDGRTCSVTDFFACLSPNQTAFWLASELDPGVTGYMLVVAVNENGLPMSYNHLLGSAKVKFTSGHAANLSALAFAALYPDRTVLPGLQVSATSADLKLDGLQYSLAPQMLAVSNFPSPVDNNAPLLIVNPVGGDLSSGDTVNTVSGLVGQVLNDKERAFSFLAAAQTCQLRETLSDRYPRIPFGMAKIIPSGTSGALKFSDVAGVPLAGAVINYNPNVTTSVMAYNQGHNLHHLSYTDKAKYVVPIYRPQ